MKTRLIRLLSEANIPIRYRHATLANYRIDKHNVTQIKEAKAYCQDIIEAEKYSSIGNKLSACHDNLTIIGNVGIGKTRLAVSILRFFIEQGIEGVFYRISELLRIIKDSFDLPSNVTGNESFSPNLIGRCCEISFLVIDDLGCCRHTPWVDEVLDDIFSERSAEGLPTVITSNLSESQLRDYLGDRVYSRLIKGGRLIPLIGEDRRPQRIKDTPPPEEIILWQAVDRLKSRGECTNQPETYDDFIRIFEFSLTNAIEKKPSWSKFKAYYVDCLGQDIEVVKRAFSEYCQLTEGQEYLSEERDRLPEGQKNLSEGQKNLSEGQEHLSEERDHLPKGQEHLSEGQEESTLKKVKVPAIPERGDQNA